jgi:hypothetical protein
MRVVFGLRVKQWDPRLETFERYEVDVRYVNSDFIKASFQDKTKAIAFLRIHQLSTDL